MSTSAHSTPRSSPGSSPEKRRTADEARRRSPTPFVSEDHRGGRKPVDPRDQEPSSRQATVAAPAAPEGSRRSEKAPASDSLPGTPLSLSDESSSPEKTRDDPPSHKAPLLLRDSQEEGSVESSLELSMHEEHSLPASDQGMDSMEGEGPLTLNMIALHFAWYILFAS